MDENGKRKKNPDRSSDGKESRESRKKERLREDGGEVMRDLMNVVDVLAGTEEGNRSEGNNGAGHQKKEKEKKKKKKKKEHQSYEDIGDVVKRTSVTEGKQVGHGTESSDEIMMNRPEVLRKEKKKRKRSRIVDLQAVLPESKTMTPGHGSGSTESHGDELHVADGNKDEKKRKKRKRDRDGGDVLVTNGEINGKEVENKTEQFERTIEEAEYPERKRRKKRKYNDTLEAAAQAITGEKVVNESSIMGENIGNASSKKSEVGGAKTVNNDVIAKVGNKVKKKKKKKKQKKGEIVKNGQEENGSKIVPRTAKGVETMDLSKNSMHKGSSRRVSFSKDVEVFPFSEDGEILPLSGDTSSKTVQDEGLLGSSEENGVQEGGLVRGKRFSKEEDELVKESVLNYINTHELGEQGLEMVLHCKKYPAIKHCWKEIGLALPWRPHQSVYHRAHILFERDENRTWTPEECEIVRKFHEKHGSDWKTLAEALGKHRFHVKDTWRRIKLPNAKSGHWSQDEYQTLFDLVNEDLRMKACEETRSKKHGMLRDNICWTAISDKLETRGSGICCMKWYKQLASPMVAKGQWIDTDDYHLVIALYNLDASCMEDVDWDDLLEHRPGDVCRKRWNQMVKHLGEHGNKSFADQVELLAQRYCPDILEAKEAYDSKPVV